MSEMSIRETTENFEARVFENRQHWERQRVHGDEIGRVDYTASFIPEGVTDLLDVGCGGGLFLNRLAERRRFHRLVGIDRSEEALESVATEKFRGEIKTLPFKDQEFGMVSALEVLEHLSLDSYESAKRELCRVSGEYILVSVPNDEKLEDLFICCPECRTLYHPYNHKRSFRTLAHLFEGEPFQLVREELYHLDRKPLFRGELRYLFGKKGPFPGTACPVCGLYTLPEGDSSSKRKATPLRTLVEGIWPKRKKFRWIIALFRREEKR